MQLTSFTPTPVEFRAASASLESARSNIGDLTSPAYDLIGTPSSAEYQARLRSAIATGALPTALMQAQRAVTMLHSMSMAPVDAMAEGIKVDVIDPLARVMSMLNSVDPRQPEQVRQVADMASRASSACVSWMHALAPDPIVAAPQG